MAPLMPMFRHYACPDCGGTFRWMHHPLDEPPPHYCPLCGNDMTAEPVFVPAAPHIAKTIGKTADGVYRQMEQAGNDHAQLAAEIAGGDKSDYAGLQITDLPDYLKPGEVAAKLPENPVGQFMSDNKAGGFVGMTGADYAANTSQGAYPRSGDATRRNLATGHADRMRAIESSGRVSRTK